MPNASIVIAASAFIGGIGGFAALITYIIDSYRSPGLIKVYKSQPGKRWMDALVTGLSMFAVVACIILFGTALCIGIGYLMFESEW